MNFYRHVIKLWREIPALLTLDNDSLHVWGLEREWGILVRRWKNEEKSIVFCIFNFSKADTTLDLESFLPEGRWRRILDSSQDVWRGPGTLLPQELDKEREITLRGESIAVYAKEDAN